MKLIYSKTRAVTNVSTGVTASSENPNFPATNLLLGQVSKVWRSVSASPQIATQTLTIAVPAGVTNAIGIFGTNAISIAYAIKDVTEVTTYFSGTLDTTPSSPARTYNRAWLEWASNGFALHIILTLTASATATYHECGEIVVGETVTIPDPRYGLGQTRENYQVIQKKSGGGEYIHDGFKPRAFDLSWVMLRETEFDDLDEIFSVTGENPVAMMLSDFLDNDFKWCGYFHMTGSPKASHDYPSCSSVSLQIREAV